MRKRTEISAALVALAGASVVLSPAWAHAYCLMATCPAQKAPWQVCQPAKPNDCGTPLFWPGPCVGFTLQKDASSQVSLADAEAVFEAAFATWMKADCGDGAPSIRVDYMGTVTCDEPEYNTEKANANVILFRDDSWPHEGAGILALTTVTYSKSTGEIYDADMEVNTKDNVFTLGDQDPELDLLSIATHEAGHFLGLAHSPEKDATMYYKYSPGTTKQRHLTPDDIAAVCAAYPPDKPKGSECNTEPRHGFSPLCAADQPDEQASGEGGSGGEGSGGSEGGEGGSSAEGGSAGPGPRGCNVAMAFPADAWLSWLALLAMERLAWLRRKKRQTH